MKRIGRIVALALSVGALLVGVAMAPLPAAAFSTCNEDSMGRIEYNPNGDPFICTYSVGLGYYWERM